MTTCATPTCHTVPNPSRRHTVGDPRFCADHQPAAGASAPVPTARPAWAEPDLGPVSLDEWTLTPGVIDTDAIEAFTQGYCGNLAVAILDRLEEEGESVGEGGWQLLWLTDPDEIDEDDMWEAWEPAVSLHYAVVSPDGTALDITGPRPVGELLDEWGAQGRELSDEEYDIVLPQLRRHLSYGPGYERDNRLLEAAVDSFAAALLDDLDY